MDKFTLVLAHQIERQLWQGWLDYLAECEADRKAGFRPHYCEHGKNQWVDYDNICGMCESGITMRDGVERRSTAIHMAKDRAAEIDRLVSAASALHKANVEFDGPAWAARIRTLTTVGQVA